MSAVPTCLQFCIPPHSCNDVFLIYVRQMFSVIHFVNVCCDRKEPGTPRPLFPLQISRGTVYYLKDVVGEYQIFLGWFNIESPSQDGMYCVILVSHALFLHMNVYHTSMHLSLIIGMPVHGSVALADQL